MTTYSSRHRKPSHTVIKAINAFAKSTARSHTALERTAQAHHTKIAEHNLHSRAYKTIACEVALTARRGL